MKALTYQGAKKVRVETVPDPVIEDPGDILLREAKGSAVETALTTLKVEGSSGKAVRQSIAATHRGGTVSLPGVYAGWVHGFLLGDGFEKGLTFKMGQTHGQKFMPELLTAIIDGKLQPNEIISHRMPLSEAERGYEIFNEKKEECRKVVLTP